MIGSFYISCCLMILRADLDGETDAWVPAASFLRSFLSVATQVTQLFRDCPIIVYAMERASPMVFTLNILGLLILNPRTKDFLKYLVRI